MMQQDAGRRVAEGRDAARALRVHVRASRQEAAVHGQRVRPVARVEPRRRRSTGTCSSSRCTRGLQRFVEDLNRALRARAGAARGGLRAGGLRVDRLQRLRVERDLADPPRPRSATTGSSSCSTGRRSCAQSYRVGVPEPGYYRELLNSDASAYGGSNVGNEGGRASEPVAAHGHAQSLVLTLPPLGVLFLKRDWSKACQVPGFLRTPTSGQRLSGDALPQLAHIVAAQLAQRVGDERPDHLLAPDQLEVGVVHRLADGVRGVGGGGDRRRRSSGWPTSSASAASATASAATRRRRGRCARLRPCRRRRAATAAATDSDREVERAAAPQLPVGAAPARLIAGS